MNAELRSPGGCPCCQHHLVTDICRHIKATTNRKCIPQIHPEIDNEGREPLTRRVFLNKADVDIYKRTQGTTKLFASNLDANTQCYPFHTCMMCSLKYTLRACSRATKQLCDLYDVANNLAAPLGETRALAPSNEYHLIPGSITWGKYTQTIIPRSKHPPEHQIRVFGIDVNEANAEHVLLHTKGCIDVHLNKDHYICTYADLYHTQLACRCYQQGQIKAINSNGDNVLFTIRTEMVSRVPAPHERQQIIEQLDAHKDLEAHSPPQRIIMEDAIHGIPMPTEIANNLIDIAAICVEAENRYSSVLANVVSKPSRNVYLPTLREYIESFILRGEAITVWGIAAIMLRRPSQSHIDAIRLIFEYIPSRGNAITLSSDDIIECLHPRFLQIDPNELSVAQTLDAYYFIVTSKRRAISTTEIHRLQTCIYRDFLPPSTMIPQYQLLRDSTQRTTPPQASRRPFTNGLARGLRSYLSKTSSKIANLYMQTKTCLRFLQPWGSHCARPWEDLDTSSSELSAREQRTHTSDTTQAIAEWPNSLAVHDLTAERARSFIRTAPANMVTNETDDSLAAFFTRSREDEIWEQRNYQRINLQWIRLRYAKFGREGKDSEAVCAASAASAHYPDRTHACDRVLHTVRNNIRMLQPMYHAILQAHCDMEICWRAIALDLHRRQWEDATLRYNMEEEALGPDESPIHPRVLINASIAYAPPYTET